MPRRYSLLLNMLALILMAHTLPGWPKIFALTPVRASAPDEAGEANAWKSPAWFHHGFKSARGTLIFDTKGIEFRPGNGSPVRWPFVDIQTLYILPRRITVIGYEKRGRLRPGTKLFRFDLGSNLPQAVAAQLAKSVGKPVRNGDLMPESSSIAMLPARHRTALGGTKSNGVLQFRDEGIEYISHSANDSRSWRWTDIQTLTSADPFKLTVFGYIETYSFDLKQPLDQTTYDRLTDEVYRHHEELRGISRNKGANQ